MAKLTMSKMMVIAAKEDRKAILERVQRYGLVEPYDREEEDCFQHIDTAGQVALFERNVQAAEQSLEVLNTHAPEKKSLLDSFNGRRQLSVEEYATQEKEIRATHHVISDLVALAQQLSECKAEVVRLTAQLSEMEPWLSLDVSPALESTQYTCWAFGSVPYAVEEGRFMV